MNDLVEALRKTSESIKEANVPPEFQQKAFEILLNHVLKPVQTISAASNQIQAEAQNKEMPVSGLERLANRLNVPLEKVNDYFSYDSDEDRVILSLSTKQLPGKKSNSTQMIALLLAAANETLFPEPRETSYSEVRDWATYYSCCDSTNFSKSLSRLDDKIKKFGKGSKTTFTLKQAGWEEAADLMQGLIS